MKRRALCFDLDNTLLNRDRAFAGYAASLMDRAPQGFCSWSREEALGELVRLDGRGLVERPVYARAVLARFPDLPCTPEDLEADFDRIVDFVVPETAHRALLQRLRPQHLILLLSNGSSARQRGKLARAGLAEAFDHIGISGEWGAAKPDPRFFQRALALCEDLPAVMIGDDYHRDMAPAQALGMETIWIQPRCPVPPGPAPTAILPSLDSLEEVLACLR